MKSATFGLYWWTGRLRERGMRECIIQLQSFILWNILSNSSCVLQIMLKYYIFIFPLLYLCSYAKYVCLHTHYSIVNENIYESRAFRIAGMNYDVITCPIIFRVSCHKEITIDHKDAPTNHTTTIAYKISYLSYY